MLSSAIEDNDLLTERGAMHQRTIPVAESKAAAVRIVKCEVCSIKSVFKCAGCGCCYYCSKEHQKYDWKRHKRLCKVLIKKKLSSQSSFMKRKHNITQFGPEDCFINAKDLSCYEELVAFVHKALMKTGLCVIDDYIHHNIAEGVMYETETLYRTPGVFLSADNSDNNGSCSSADGKIKVKKYRSDEIAWITGKEKLSKHIEVLCETFDNLIHSLKLKGNSPTHKSKIQVSCFPGDSHGYVSHVDNPANNGRLLTTVYHCNKHYNRDLYGGVSRYYFRNGKFVDVEPKFNRAVIHWSDRRIVHETLPCRSRIFSLTSWYLDCRSVDAMSRENRSHINIENNNCMRDKYQQRHRQLQSACTSARIHTSNSRAKTKIIYSADLMYPSLSTPCTSSSTTTTMFQNEKRFLEEHRRHLVEDLEKFRRLAGNVCTPQQEHHDRKPVFTNMSTYPVLTKV